MPKPHRAAILCLGLAAACPAGAQISPDELWRHWQQAASGSERSLTAAAASGPDGSLALSGLRLSLPVLGAPGVIALGTVRLAADGSGGVRVVIPAGQALRLDLSPPDQAPIRFDLPVSGAGFELRATGAPGAVAYDIDGADVTVDGTPLTSEPAAAGDRIRLTVPGLSGHVAPDGTAAFAAPKLDFDLAATDPGSGRRSRLAGQHDHPTLAVTAEPGIAPDRPATRIALTSARAVQDWQTTGPDGAVTGARIDRDQGTLALTLGPARFEARSYEQGFRLTALPAAPGLPAHGLRADSLDLSLAGPAALAGGDRTVSLGAVADGLDLAPEDWALIDPQGRMPRAPGGLVIDLDLVPEIVAQRGLPDLSLEGRLRSATVHRISLDLAGVTLDASGDVRFVPAPTPETPDAALPVGRFETAATGVYGLLQTLTASGLLSQDQAFGLSMAMMMFAQPGDGDSLTSSIVAGADGTLTVNGRPLTAGMP